MKNVYDRTGGFYMNKLKTIFRSLHWKNILGLTIAGLINAFGITIFLSPVNLYDSGISCTSMLLSQITPVHLSLSVFLIILNIPLFLYGWKKQGSTFTIYAIYVVAITPARNSTQNIEPKRSTMLIWSCFILVLPSPP